MDFHMKIFYNPVITVLAQISPKELNALVTGFLLLVSHRNLTT